MRFKHNRVKDFLIMFGVLLAAALISLAFQHIFDVEEQITDLFIFAVFLTALWTDGYICGIIAAFIGMLAVNFAFTSPLYVFSFSEPENILAAVVMFVISILTSTFTSQLKVQEMLKAENTKERMRSNLLRAVSHDLRTPLTTIYGSSSTLLANRKNLSDEQQDRILHGIQEDSEWLMRMVENLLSVTRIDSGRVKITKIPTVLDEMIDSAALKFNKRYPGQPLVIDVPEDIMVIPMDSLLIEQVIINILENAVHHARGMTALFLSVSEQDSRAVFEISDDGCGIDEARLPHIFTGSYTADAVPSDSKKRNTGIGLSVCATIVRAHGGEIYAENRPGGGAMFRFILNMEEEANDE